MKTSRVPVGRSVVCRSPLSSDTSPPAARAAFWQMLPLLIKVYRTSLAVGLEHRLWRSRSVGSEDRNWPDEAGRPSWPNWRYRPTPDVCDAQKRTVESKVSGHSTSPFDRGALMPSANLPFPPGDAQRPHQTNGRPVWSARSVIASRQPRGSIMSVVAALLHLLEDAVEVISLRRLHGREILV